MRSVFVFCIVAILLTGCSHKQTYTTKEGTTTVEGTGSNQTVTIHSKEGTATYGKAAVDPAKLGIPVYPGATTTEGSMAGTSAQGSGEVVTLSTTDSFDKVYSWYQAHLPAGSQKMHMSTDSGSVASFEVGENSKEQRSVMITSEKDKTSILLSHSVKR